MTTHMQIEPTYRLFVTKGSAAQKDFAYDKATLRSHLNQHLAQGCDSIYVIEVASGVTQQVKLVDGKAVWTETPADIAKMVQSYF